MRDGQRARRGRGALVLVLCTFWLGCAEGVPTKKVLLIGLDGVRTDILAAAATPVIDSLIGSGAFSDHAWTSDPTVSGPGWSSMLTGVWPEKHGVLGNDFKDKRYDRYPDFLTRLEQVDSSYFTFAVVDWPPLGTAASNGPVLSDRLDVKRAIDGDSLGYRVADSLSVALAAEYLAAVDIDAAFVYLGDIDVVGHETSSLAPEYRAAIEWADRKVGELLAALRRRPSYGREDWLVLLATDHGRTDAGGHGGTSDQEHTVFFLASGPSVVQGTTLSDAKIVDVAVTALTHLGVAIDPAWGLDGKALGLKTRP